MKLTADDLKETLDLFNKLQIFRSRNGFVEIRMKRLDLKLKTRYGVNDLDFIHERTSFHKLGAASPVKGV